MSIPKIIHYCWFGKEIPAKVLKVIDSWRENLPDYEFYLWGNEHIVSRLTSSHKIALF